MEGANFYSPFERLKNPFNIDVKMMSMDFTERSGAQIILKCLKSLGLTWFLPPPGGAHAATKTQSEISINKNFFKS